MTVPGEKSVPTADRFMNDCEVDGCPPTGADVLATNNGGVTIRTTWKKGDEKHFVAWEYHGRLKPETRQRLLARSVK
jgi:hypothetical protein